MGINNEIIDQLKSGNPIATGWRSGFWFSATEAGYYDGSYAIYDNETCKLTYTNTGYKVKIFEMSDYELIDHLIFDREYNDIDQIMDHFIFDITDDKSILMIKDKLRNYAELVLISSRLDIIDSIDLPTLSKIEFLLKTLNVVIEMKSKYKGSDPYFNMETIYETIDCLENEFRFFIEIKPFVGVGLSSKMCTYKVHHDGLLVYSSNILENKYAAYADVYNQISNFYDDYKKQINIS